jgi:hypothetical protein
MYLISCACASAVHENKNNSLNPIDFIQSAVLDVNLNFVRYTTVCLLPASMRKCS